MQRKNITAEQPGEAHAGDREAHAGDREADASQRGLHYRRDDHAERHAADRRSLMGPSPGSRSRSRKTGSIPPIAHGTSIARTATWLR
jgi:hypothetical protein